MPRPKRLNSRTVWDRKKLDDAFDALPDNEDRNPWDDAALKRGEDENQIEVPR